MSETLKDIAKRIRATGNPRQITVRDLLAAIGQKRRGKLVASQLNTLLAFNGLDCNPGFDNMHFDASVTLSKRQGVCGAEMEEAGDQSDTEIEIARVAKVAADQDSESPFPRAKAESANPNLESSALMTLWRAMQRNPSSGPNVVFESFDSKFSVSVDAATSAWVIDLEFPAGGPKPELTKSLKYVTPLPERRTATNHRLLSITYDPTGNDCVDFWPHFAEVILTEAAATKPKTHCAQSVERTFKKWKKRWPTKGKLGHRILLGLFAELVFLRTLAKILSPATAVRDWQGLSARDHDFSIRGTAFEVKGGSGKKVTISNLHQLNDEGVAALYLVQITLRVSDDKRDSLQALCEGIQSTLASDPALLAMFIRKLGKAKWFKAPKDTMESFKYRVAGRSIYHVTEEFPRILKRDLSEKFKPGVDLKTYEVILAHCPAPLEKTSEDELWARLRTHAGDGVVGSD